ncbi:MAG: hypothetical protein QOJ96_1707 [Alphaproteobacteria bacterium]|nr:hypothetical protein [Alphaproteobacteria bacterium]
MNPIDLIVTVCAVLAPATCEETHLVFSYSGSLQQCVMAAPPYIAQWVGEHPKWNAVRWRCEYPHSNDKADAAGQRPQADPGFRYLLQSFKSLSAIEKTASALTSISRTRHCLESR